WGRGKRHRPAGGPQGREGDRAAPAGTAGGGAGGDVVTNKKSAPCAARTCNDPPQTGARLEPFRAILRLFGHGSRFVQVGPRLPPALPCPWLPAPRAVADAVVGDHR